MMVWTDKLLTSRFEQLGDWSWGEEGADCESADLGEGGQ